ncbi:MAG: hypothetical protein QMD04_13340 [Anaerolineales bacterium]|nr:hypothetical protein [Anaerolineales bacterium]
MTPALNPRFTPGASVTPLADGGWHLEIPSGQRGQYRLAQLDDYSRLSRRAFLWRPPLTPREPRGVALSLRARLSATDLPGTWGFGLWNDPFGFALGFGGTARRLPALPNAAWFFHASPENFLSLRGAERRSNPLAGGEIASGKKRPRNDTPANGFFAGTFRSPRWPSPLLTPALMAAPLLALRPASRLLRRLAGQVVRQDGRALEVDVTQWHAYSIRWQAGAVVFLVDGAEILCTPLAPRSPLGLVIWIDNQYAAWRPDGSLGYGTLANLSAWMEVDKLHYNCA